MDEKCLAGRKCSASVNYFTAAAALIIDVVVSRLLPMEVTMNHIQWL